MSVNDGSYNNLRKKLDLMGYTQTLPVLGIPLVEALFGDLIKTTESLRDTKKENFDLLGERTCWELGVEPYKCSNSRLVTECNELNQQLLKDREEFELQICELNKKIRNLQTDKQHLEAHSQQLEQQLDILRAKYLEPNKKKSQGSIVQKVKKPFITTVRSGNTLPPLSQYVAVNPRCTKCNAGIQLANAEGAATADIDADQEKYDKLENTLKDSTDQLDFYQRKVDRLNREVQRLTNLLIGGRPPAALAKDCCQKDLVIKELNYLKGENEEYQAQIHKYKDKMHEAMQQALKSEEDRSKLHKELTQLKTAALEVETQANLELSSRDEELSTLVKEIKDLRLKNSDLQLRASKTAYKRNPKDESLSEKHALKEKINILTQRESELKISIDKLKKKLRKVSNNHEKKQDKPSVDPVSIDEEKIRLKTERDFFQTEYLRMINKMSAETEIELLQLQIKEKNEELQKMRSEQCLVGTAMLNPKSSEGICHYESLPSTTTRTAAPCLSSPMLKNQNSDCVQAVIMRNERERDCARAELEHVKHELAMLQDKHHHDCHMHSEEMKSLRRHCQELNENLRHTERENREINSQLLPKESTIIQLKEEIKNVKHQLNSLQEEHAKLENQYTQLKLVHEQTEHSFAEIKSKLAMAERELQTSDTRFNTINSRHESKRNETVELLGNVSSLKNAYITLEHDKDKLLNQLDAKTEYSNRLECELKVCRDERIKLEIEMQDLNEQLSKLNLRFKKTHTELNECHEECTTWRQQKTTFKRKYDQAVAENGKLSDELTTSQAEVRILKKKLTESDSEIELMKQQLRQYVQEIKRVEDLLTDKQREHDEMLEHYQSLSHDAVTLEGNKHNLEAEVEEYKQQICDLESEVAALRRELCCRQETIACLEDKISTSSSSIACLRSQLEETIDTLHLRNEDLSARKELCDKLDIEKFKLNAELKELNEIRKKLERENEKLRSEINSMSTDRTVSHEAMAELLVRTRQQLENQISTDAILNQELERLRHQLDSVMQNLAREQQQSNFQKSLANELKVQVNELSRNLTDDRFRQARSNEEASPSLNITP